MSSEYITSTQYLKNIIDDAEDSAGKTTTTDADFQILIERARERESKFLSQIDPRFREPDGSINLNRLIERVDNEYNFKNLLPGKGVENWLVQEAGYDFSGKETTASLSDEQKEQALNYLKEHWQEITQNFSDEITALFQTGKLRGAVRDPIVNAIKEFLVSKGAAAGLRDSDLGQITGKINTQALSFNAAKTIKYQSKWREYNVVTIDLKKIEVTGTRIFSNMDNMSQQILYNLATEELDKFAQKRNTLTKQNITNIPEQQKRQDVRQAIANVCPSALSSFDASAGQVSIAGNIGNLRGFLGEVRAHAIISVLFPGLSNAAKFNGLAKVDIGSTTGKESPIDVIGVILEEEFGFQSKNTTSGTYTWGQDSKEIVEEGSIPAPKFYSQKINEALEGAESSFFRAYSYNEPIPDAIFSYQEQYKRFNQVFQTSFVKKFESLAFKIIRQQIEDTGGKLLYNDFFLMNNQIIPASTILAEMQLALSKKTTAYIKSSFDWFKSGLVWQKSTDPREGGDPANTKIGYKVSFNINNLAKRTSSYTF